MGSLKGQLIRENCIGAFGGQGDEKFTFLRGENSKLLNRVGADIIWNYPIQQTFLLLLHPNHFEVLHFELLFFSWHTWLSLQGLS